MYDRPFVSVVMTVLDPDTTYFPQAVKSVLGQTYEEFELVIIEDPGASSGQALLSALRDPRIRHHCNKSRTSHVAQRNQSLRYAEGELVAVLDADDVCYPRRLEEQVEFLRHHPDVSVVGSQLEIIDASGMRIGWRRYPLDHRGIMNAMPRFNPIAQPSVMFRKDVVLSAGAYQYDRYPAVEDYELFSRLARRGVRFANHSEPLLRYRIHGGAMKATKLHNVIRGTLDVKRMYWSDSLGWRGHLRMLLERALLFLPGFLVLRLFLLTQYRTRPLKARNSDGPGSISG